MSEEQLPLGLRPRCGEWIGAVISLPRYVSNDGPPYRPSAVIWFEPESGMIVGCEAVRPTVVLDRAADLFLETAASPMSGEDRMPRRVRVSTTELALALDGHVGDVEIVIAPTPEIDRLAASLFERLIDRDQEDERELTYVGPDMTAGDIARFFRAAARLYGAAPWRVVPPDVFLSAACARLGIEAGALCVVGQADEQFGFALTRSIEDANAYLDACERRMDGEAATFPSHIMLSYTERPIADALAREITAHGWEIAGQDAFPTVVVVDGDLVSRGLTREELAGVTVLVEALAGLAGDGRLADAWDGGEPITWKHSEDGIEVVLGAPLWLDDEETVRRRSFEVLGRFAECSGVEEHLGWLELLINYCVDYTGAALSDVSPNDLDELLFDIVPRKVSCEPEDAPAIVAAVRAFLAFASDELGSSAARENLSSLRPDASQQLARRLADPRNFGMAKSVVMAATREGYERSEAGFAAYLKMMNGRIPLASSTRDRHEPRRQADKAKRAKRKSQRKARKNSRKR